MEYKNKIEIEALRNELKKKNPEIDYNDFTQSLMFASIDGHITKLKHLENILSIWEKKVKPQRLATLKAEQKFLEQEIKNSKELLENEYEILKAPEYNNIAESEQNDKYFYTTLKRTINASQNAIGLLYKRYHALISEKASLESNNGTISIDGNGKITVSDQGLNEIYQNIRNEILGTIQVSISKERLRQVILENALDQEEDADF